MKPSPKNRPSAAGSVIAYFLFAIVIIGSIATLYAYSVQNLNLTHRRHDLAAAYEYAEAGTVIGCTALENAFTNSGGNLLSRLQAAPNSFTKNNDLSTPQQLVFERLITAPFTNQTATVQLWMANSAAPSKARIVATAKVGGVTQTNIMHVEMAFGWGAAIISDNPGSSATGTSKSVAQDGNVVVDGSTSATSTTVVDGGILANGRANTNACRLVPGQMMRGGQPFRASMSMTNRSTAFQIPDYTADGSADQLFDFDRFIAAAKASGNYFTNLTSFVNVMKTGVVLEGIVAVDVAKSGLPSLSPSTLPFGINIRGTLVFNFSSAYSPSDKVANTAAMNINPANLSGLIPGNPATYTTGYPPVYSNPAKNPANVDITSRGFANFTPYDDLPALMYNVGILDMHGPVNISGVVYSPSFMEIENKQDGQIQYFKGSLIGGGGILVENNKRATSIVSYDPNAMDILASSGTKGKSLKVVYRE
ncbi:hypothetical protein LBMAG56_50000 [Verrucomicrobiota bacterium]|nr:hypothetical protein LBMAG56_50000 [Verrucomicrobiota bacterium]